MDGTVNSARYREILDNKLWPVIAKHFGNESTCFRKMEAERKEIYEIYEKNEIYALYEIYEKQASTHETMKSNRLRGETESVAKTEQGKNDREMFKHFTDACK
ncbi:hypothetical protein ACHWQZ_G002560 [Mnemiopsis leidyi]